MSVKRYTVCMRALPRTADAADALAARITALPLHARAAWAAASLPPTALAQIAEARMGHNMAAWLTVAQIRQLRTQAEGRASVTAALVAALVNDSFFVPQTLSGALPRAMMTGPRARRLRCGLWLMPPQSTARRCCQTRTPHWPCCGSHRLWGGRSSSSPSSRATRSWPRPMCCNDVPAPRDACRRTWCCGETMVPVAFCWRTRI